MKQPHSSAMPAVGTPADAHRRQALASLAALAAALSWPAIGQAAGPAAHTGFRPDGPVQLYNGFSAGGAADLLCRILAKALQGMLGQAVVVENRPGANGFIAAQAVSRAAPDGRTLGLATMSMLTIAPQLPGMQLTMDPRQQLSLISPLASIYSLLVSAPDAPFTTVPELIAYAKKNPGQVSYASAGTGSTPHLAGELFARQAGLDLLHVPYKGGAQAMVDLQAGRVHILIGNMPDFLGQVKTGALRGLAFGGDQVAPALPHLPRIKQWLPDYDVTNWFGIVGPPDMPSAVVQALNAAIQQALALPEVRQQMAELGAEGMSGDAASFQALVERDYTRWGDIIRAADIRIV